jgi:hypothetical protein
MGTLTKRKYALTKLREGDYVCPSNDGRFLWRFQRYQDGRASGLDVRYELRWFWQASKAPMPWGCGTLVAMDDLAWRLTDSMLPTRTAAIEAMLQAQ